MRGKALASILAAACCLGLATGCSANNTGSDGKGAANDASSVKMDDSSPTALLDSFAKTVESGGWDDIPQYFSSNERPRMAGKEIRKALTKSVSKHTVGESYYDDDNNIIVPFTWGDSQDEEVEVVKTPEGGYRISEVGDLLQSAYAGICIEGYKETDETEYMIPGHYSFSCPTAWGGKVSQEYYTLDEEFDKTTQTVRFEPDEVEAVERKAKDYLEDYFSEGRNYQIRSDTALYLVNGQDPGDHSYDGVSCKIDNSAGEIALFDEVAVSSEVEKNGNDVEIAVRMSIPVLACEQVKTDHTYSYDPTLRDDGNGCWYVFSVGNTPDSVAFQYEFNGHEPMDGFTMI